MILQSLGLKITELVVILMLNEPFQLQQACKKFCHIDRCITVKGLPGKASSVRIVCGPVTVVTRPFTDVILTKQECAVKMDAVCFLPLNNCSGVALHEDEVVESRHATAAKETCMIALHGATWHHKPSEAARPAQNRLLWRDKTCPARV